MKFYPKGVFDDSTFCHFFMKFSKNREWHGFSRQLNRWLAKQ